MFIIYKNDDVSGSEISKKIMKISLKTVITACCAVCVSDSQNNHESQLLWGDCNFEKMTRYDDARNTRISLCKHTMMTKMKVINKIIHIQIM